MPHSTPITADMLARRIAQARGHSPADLVIRDIRLFDLVTGEMRRTDIAICGGVIVGVSGGYQGQRVIEGRGRVAVPGFVDAHLHVESSLVTPMEFDRCVARHGVTTAVCDPHEIANVMGTAGFDFMLEGAGRTLMDMRVNLSSCVPATTMETAGAEVSVADLLRYADHPRVIGLAEFMNFPGVVHADPACLDKLAAFAGRHIDGHAPLLGGRDLDAYVATGIRTEHESTSVDEAREKIARGMTVFIREGSVSKDLKALAPLLSVATAPFLAFCTDDRNPLDIAEEGHLDFVIRTAIASGCAPLAVYRAACLTGALAFGLTDRGLIAPGRRADIVLLDDLEACAVTDVIAAGVRISDEARTLPPVPPVGLDSMKARPVDAADFRMATQDGPVPVIGVIPGKIITAHLRLDLPRHGGETRIDLAQDVVKVAVVERHGRNGNIGRGFVKGFGLKTGAIASSVGHDSHNITVVGASEADMAVAVNACNRMGGGFVVASGGDVRAALPLPIAGLMSTEPYEALIAPLEHLRHAARACGVTLAEPFLQVAFLPLPVIPHLKISDHGLVDVDRFAVIG